jgi:UDP-2,3-diacylglucosamine pyrophosphatase LpxH
MKMDNTTLYIIGNGFDLFHGIRSNYFAFRDYVKKNNKKLYHDVLFFFDCIDLWGDFEANLASLSRDKIMQQVDLMLEINMTTYDEDDDNFSYADYFSSIELGTEVIERVTGELMSCFRKWIGMLDPGNRKLETCERLLDRNASYINFNYTEFLESLYGISKEQILYIHGDRRDKKKKLILGHGKTSEQIFDEWYDVHKSDKRFQDYQYGRKGRRYKNDDLTYLTYFLKDETKGNWRNAIRYHAANNAAETIGAYYDNSAKKVKKVIHDNEKFFNSLKNIKYVTVIGHSLSVVDRPYFEQIIEENKNPQELRWRISWYNDDDRDRIKLFTSQMNIDEQNLETFKLSID